VQTFGQNQVHSSDYPILSLLENKLDSNFELILKEEVTGLDADRQSALAEISRLKVSVCACTLQSP